MLYRLLVSFCFVSLITSCSTGEIEPADTLLGKDYFALYPGRYVVYDVTRITFDELFPGDTSIFEMREEVAEEIVGLDGKPAYRIERSVRAIGTTQWKIDSVWTARIEGQKVVQVENNIPFVKMILPLEDEMQWDGNRLNTLQTDWYRVDSLGKEAQFGDILLPNTVHIIQNTDSTIISRDVRWEVYADSIGLVKKRTELYKYITDANNNFYNTDSIIGGVFLDMIVVDYGTSP